MKKLTIIAITIFSVLLTSASVFGQILIPNSSSVTENFDGIGISGTANLPTNWKMSSAGTGATSNWTTVTNVTSTTQQASSGSPTTGGRYNWATTAATDRAIGFMTSSGYASPNSILAFYRNTSGTTISDLTINFQFERYRINTANASVTFFTSTDGSSWTSIPTGDIATTDFPTGANTYTFGSPTIVTRTVVLSGVNIANNGDFYLRWVANTTGANSQGIGLDDVTLTPTLVPLPNLSINDVSMNEGNSGTTTFSFTVSLSAPAPAGGVTFDIATADNTAMTADNDYVQKTLTSQTIPAGSSTYAFDVLVNGDTAIEPNESFFVNVTNVMNAVVTDGQGQGTITNDDFDTTAPVISYTPLSNINTAADRNLSVTATDAVGVTVMAITWIDPTFGVVMNPCSLSTGTAQSGVWNCTIVGASTTSPGAIAYRVTASDAAMNGTVNPSGGVNNLYTIGAATIPAGNYANMNPGDGVTLGGNVNVSGVLTLGGIVNTGTNILTLGCDTTVAGGGTSNYVIGNLAKDYCTTGTFTYPVGTALLINAQLGTASGYSPFTANVTALATVPSTLTVNVTDGFLTGTDAAQSASRFWNVTETGELTADISFTYLDEDIIGTETGYKVLRRSGTTAVYPGGTVNDVTNTATAPGVTNFSGWAAGNLAPTAANASVSGRVSTANGYGIRNVTVMITGGGLTAPRYIKTGTFGSYQFNDLPVGQTYVVSVLSKKYNFPTPSIVLNLQDNVGDADFVAEDR